MNLTLKVPPVVQWLLCAGLMWAVARALPPAGWPEGLAQALGMALILAGGAIGFLGVRRFSQHQTTVDPRVPDKASALVTDGVYRHTRNPMYLGLALGLFGWGWLLNSPWSWLLIPAWMAYMNRFQIRPEESALAMQFGQPYLEYCQRVRRWL